MRPPHSLRFALFLFSTCVTACGSPQATDDAALDGASSFDAQTSDAAAIDAGPRPDTGSPGDSALPADQGVPPEDAGAGDSGPVDIDAATADSGLPGDAGPRLCGTDDCARLDGPCVRGACVAGECVRALRTAGASCDDRDLCTSNDRCEENGVCAGSAVVCMGNACNTASCDPATGSCRLTPTDGASCDDGAACTTGDVCLGGTCRGAQLDCSSIGDACNDGVCNPATGACQRAPARNGMACDDGMRCTQSDQCASGTCRGTTIDCSSMSTACGISTCDPATGACRGSAASNGTPCDDMDPCTIGTTCSAGFCGTPVDCGFLDTPCAAGACNRRTGICEATARNNGVACDDGTSCTAMDVCMGGFCRGTAQPTPVTNGTSLRGQSNAGGEPMHTCGSSTIQNVVYYSARVPPGEILRAIVLPGTGFNPSLQLLPQCGASTCLATAGYFFTDEPEILRWQNTGAAEQRVVLAVGGSAAGTFGLDVSIAPPPANRDCAQATALADGVTLRAQDPGLGRDGLTTACNTSDVGPNLYYTAVIPAGRTLIVSAMRSYDTRGWFPTLRVLDACGVTSCLASAAGGAATATVRFDNSTGADRTVRIALGSETAMNIGGLVDLSVSARASAYMQTTIPVACEDLSAATVLTEVNADDARTLPAALPFAFTIARDPVTHFSAHANGLWLFGTSATFTTNAYSFNTDIPDPAAPNAFIAAFWDDLYPVQLINPPPAGETSDVRIATLGTAGARRTVLQWRNFTFFSSSNRTARVTFQAKIFEGTNVVEVHYCSATPGAVPNQTAGDQATVGIEGLAGTDGVRAGYNVAGTTAPGRAYRFVPN